MDIVDEVDEFLHFLRRDFRGILQGDLAGLDLRFDLQPVPCAIADIVDQMKQVLLQFADLLIRQAAAQLDKEMRLARAFLKGQQRVENNFDQVGFFRKQGSDGINHKGHIIAGDIDHGMRAVPAMGALRWVRDFDQGQLIAA